MSKSKKMLTQAEEFLAFRQQIGYKLVREGYLLRDFGRYADKMGHKVRSRMNWCCGGYEGRRKPRRTTWHNACLSLAAWPVIWP